MKPSICTFYFRFLAHYSYINVIVRLLQLLLVFLGNIPEENFVVGNVAVSYTVLKLTAVILCAISAHVSTN